MKQYEIKYTELPSFSRIRAEEGRINLSGIETQIRRYLEEQKQEGPGISALKGPVSLALMERIGVSLKEMIEQCRKMTGIRRTLLSGGVASSRFIRRMMEGDADLQFGPPELSSDNAVGTAILGMERFIQNGGAG